MTEPRAAVRVRSGVVERKRVTGTNDEETFQRLPNVVVEELGRVCDAINDWCVIFRKQMELEAYLPTKTKAQILGRLEQLGDECIAFRASLKQFRDRLP